MRFNIIETIDIPIEKDTDLFDFLDGNSYDFIKEKLSKDPFNIKAQDKGNLYILKYSQIDSDFSYKIVRQCRGIILEKDTNKTIAYGFNKFFNIQETHAEKVDFATSSIQEKVDGSIIKVYYYEKAWRIATNGTIDAKDAEATDPLTGKKHNFYDLFHEGLEEQGVTFPELTANLTPGLTYIFELVHPITRVVVKYEKPGVYLIGIRENKTMREIDTFDESNKEVKKITSLGINRPKTFSFSSQEDMLAAAEILGANEEGYVVRDPEFKRVKVKGSLYLKMHYLKGNGDTGPKKFVEMIQANETDEFLSAFPEYTERVEELRTKINEYIKAIQEDWKDLYSAFGPDFKSRKEFAEVAKKTTNSGAMFKALDAFTRGEREIDKFIYKYVMETQTDRLLSAIGIGKGEW
jgi:hypothetical protein